MIDGISEDERMIRTQAIQHLDDAMRRYDPPAGRMHWSG
jgi:hypothetical protein